MDKETSAYLDCIRFLAALTVMVGHIQGYLVFNALPYFDHFALEAVGIFFVLSGFVIGYVTDTKEKDLTSYTINRAARIYSVVIPCLLLTFVLDSLGRHFHPAYYSEVGSHTREAFHLLFSLTFLNETWLLPHTVHPGSDGPFWSLCYEVPYYFVFGAAFYLRGLWRWLVPIAVLICAGPAIALMFPCWLAGVGIYHLCCDLHLNRLAGRAILIASILLWAVIEVMIRQLGLCSGVIDNSNSGFILICSGALPFAISIVGFRFAGIRIQFFSSPIRWLAGASFTIYLLHFPFAAFLNGFLPSSLPHKLRWVLLIFSTLGASLIVAHFTERQKHIWRIAIEKIVAKFTARKVVSF